MLLSPLRSMTRKALAVLVVLILTGVAPATAVLGFCAKMPCCVSAGHEAAGPAVGVSTADCCTTVNCYEAPSHDLTIAAKGNLLTGSVAVVPVASAVPIAPAVARAFTAASPPPTTSGRLASLSVFLI